jgi:GTPase-associated protein 1, N-terminal domain type 1
MRSVRLDQTLHGYRDGHELLAGSLQVPREARRTLLSMSDLSGPGFVAEFDGYLTGYPIAAIGTYALSRTWYAPEMARPGCVWTHTLLIDFSDIPHLDSPIALLDYFRDPRGLNGRFEVFEKRLRLASPDIDRSNLVVDEDIGIRLLRALYQDDEAPVLVQGSRTGEYDDVILGLWAQQWPRLRRKFSFCTGSFSLRSIHKAPLDLQIVPTERWSRVLRTDRSARTLTQGPQQESCIRDEWLTAAITDLRQGGSSLRAYLREFGADAPGNRASFRPLAMSFLTQEQIRRGRASLDQLVSVVGRAFTEKSGACRLKRDLLASDQDREGSSNLEVSEQDRVLAAFRTKFESAFDLHDLQIEKRADQLVQTQITGEASFLCELLLAPHVNSTGQQFLDKAVSSLSANRLAAILETDASLLERILTARPSLFYEEELWRTAGHLQRECIAVAARATEGTVDITRLLVAALSADTADVVSDAIECWGDQVMQVALAWLDDPTAQDRALGPRWVAMLRSRVADTMDWLGTEGRPMRTRTLRLLPNLVQPRDPLLERIPSPTLANWARRVNEENLSGPQTDTLAFFLTVGLSRDDRAACDLIAIAFPAVHEALLSSRLNWSAWSWLEPLMPSKDWFFSLDWDRADKLRRALLVRISEHGWPAECVRAAAYSDEARSYLKKTATNHASWERIVSEGLSHDHT